MSTITGLHISDIHFGALSSIRLYKELDLVFLNHIKNMGKCDYIMINGDLTDRKLTLNDKDSNYLLRFMDRLIKTAVKYNVKKLRIVQGTISHDLNQLNNFNHYTKLKNIDFRIIRTVEEEELFPDFKVLYVPEEYMEDSKEYYKEYLNRPDNYYQLITGHGTFDFMAFSNQKLESEKFLKNAPVFKLEEFERITNGAIIFGHIHTPNQLHNMYYISSFTRWCFGEEQPKGFIEYKYSTSKQIYKVKRIENTMAKKYITLEVSGVFDDKELKSEDKIALIESMKKDANADHVRIKFDKNDVNDEGEILILKDYFNNKNDVNLNITNNLKKEQRDEDKEFEDKYKFIFNNEYTLEKIISEYLSMKNINIPAEEILSILNEDE